MRVRNSDDIGPPYIREVEDLHMITLFSGWNNLLLAAAFFFASHAIPARPIVRQRFVQYIGKIAYLLIYSLLSVLAFAWLIIAADHAPYIAVWHFSPWQMWIPNVVMPFASLFLVFGLATPNPLSIGSYNDSAFVPDDPGIVGVTRHPLLWAAALWAFAHMVPNGDLAHVLMFGLFGAFSLLGMFLIDARKKHLLGMTEWHRLSNRTSLFPLLALVSGKFHPVLYPTSLLRFLAATILYGGLLALHRPIIGVSPLPPL